MVIVFFLISSSRKKILISFKATSSNENLLSCIELNLLRWIWVDLPININLESTNYFLLINSKMFNLNNIKRSLKIEIGLFYTLHTEY